MSNLLIDTFKNYASLSIAEITAIENSMEVREGAKGSYVLREDEVLSESFFVLAGLIREYKLAKDEEVSTNFYAEGQWIILPDESRDDENLRVNLYCLEDTELIVGNDDKATALFQLHPRLEQIARRILEDYLTEQQNAMRRFLFNTPEERYLELLQDQRGLFQRVSQVHLSSYIGVKPESLSRIRRRVHDRLSASTPPPPLS